MITKHTIYVLECDNCRKTYSQNDGYMTWFYSRHSVVKNALLDDWVKGDRSFYCPECAKKLGLTEAENGRE